MVRNYSRLNGWMPPPHPLQITAWLAMIFLIISTFGILIPSFASFRTKLTLYVLMAFSVIMNLIANILVTSIDPSDDAVRKKIRTNPRPGFDRDKHRHVIDENYFCNICETIIQPSSKHCRQCNKCVLDFDHHCKWLNNCIGAKNYKWFLFYIVSAAIASLGIFILSLALFILQFVDKSYFSEISGYLTIFGLATKDTVWLVMVALSIVVAGVSTVLLVQLLVFHLKILKRGMTTYGYIMDQRKKDEEKEKRKIEAAASVDTRLFSQTKNPVKVSIMQDEQRQTRLSQAQLITEQYKSNISRGKFEKLKKLLRMRKERNQNSAQPSASLSFSNRSQQNGSAIKKSPKEDVILVDPISGDYAKMDDKKIKTLKNDTNRPSTPLPPIVHNTNGINITNTITNIIETSQLEAQQPSKARRKKRAEKTTVIQGQMEVIDDKENRISISHIATTVSTDNGNKNGRTDSGTLNASYSRHADVPRLPPLPTVTAGTHVRTSLGVSGSNQSMLLGSALSGDELALSLTSNNVAGDDTLREIPLAAFTLLPSRVTVQSSDRRTSSGASSASSGSILAPLQVEALTVSGTQFGQPISSSNTSTVSHIGQSVANSNAGHTVTNIYVSSGQTYGVITKGQARGVVSQGQPHLVGSLPPLAMTTVRHLEHSSSLPNDRGAQFSDTGSMSSGSKRVRFSAQNQRRMINGNIKRK